MSRVILISALALAGCAAPSNEREQAFALSDDLALTLPIAPGSVREDGEGRVLVEQDGLVLRVQRIDTVQGSRSRTARSVAEALSSRYSLGEQPGELTHASCRFAGTEAAQCVTGTFDVEGSGWVRRGAVVARGAHVVWLDVVGPVERIEEVEGWSAQLASRVSLAEARPESAPREAEGT